MDRHSSPSEKIGLYRSLFRGREDVYPRRFENRRTGKSGYFPACGNEWVRGICEKPRIKCSDCACQCWLPISDAVIHQHLSGIDHRGQPFVMGIYPMLLDETCHFLAADFDGDDWTCDIAEFQSVCRRLGLFVAVERSRSGNGGHVWFFFQTAVSAALARKLGARILTETMQSRPGISLKSYDRFFPNQDTLPKGGFGNLIALPLQKQARECGNTLFLDEAFIPYEDQWAFLGRIERIGLNKIEELVSDAERCGQVIGVRLVPEEEEAPWSAPPSRRSGNPHVPGPLPEKLEAVLSDQIYFNTEEVPPPLRNRLIRLAAFQNPEFYKAQAMRMPVFGKPRIICCAEQYPNHFALPRGCLDEVRIVLDGLGIDFLLRDERCQGSLLEVSFHGELRLDQQQAANAMLEHDFGVLAATTAFGKTVLAAWLVAQRRVNTLVLVHRQQLLEQWVERLAQFLDISPKSVGRLGGGKRKLNGSLDVALIQSLVRKGVVDDRVGNYGHIIIDECHHLSAGSFELVAKRAMSRFVVGLSATVARKDGHHPIIFMQCGPVRHRVDAKKQAAIRPFAHRVFVRPTGFRSLKEADLDFRQEFQRVVEELARDDARNSLICEDVSRVLEEGRHPLVLTERTEHLLELAGRLKSFASNVVVLRGGLSRKELNAALSRLEEGPRVVLATGRFVGEGFDDARLDTLFLALPVSWRGTIAQYAGRLHRLHGEKREVRVYDYADLNVPMLARMFDRRCAGYEAIGYDILLPASAVPGWPVEVPLPVDPQWKRDYAASVMRLVRDGVTAPLGNLFVHAARQFAPDLEGIGRARSASEKFLYLRLETLGETKGLFRLNSQLPIPFDNMGNMEVDFLCSTAHLIIELDGSQHLGDPDAYRRDRRKDALLQRHGFHVLRFLCEDVGKHLDTVLDSILAALFHCRSKR